MQASAQHSLEAALKRHFDLPDHEAAAVLAALEPCVCRGGAWLFRQGEEGNALYLVARGLLQVWIDSTDPADERPRLVAEIAPGETVGEIGMLTGGRRSASIRAVRDSLLLRMDIETFDRLARQRPELIRHIAGGIAKRLRDRTAEHDPVSRVVKTIALLPLDGAPAVQGLTGRLVDALSREGSTLLLTAARMRELDAPLLPGAVHQDISPALVDWLADQEDRHRFVLFVADAAETAWSDLALRHADLILLVADAAGDAAIRPWERSLLDTAHGPAARQALVLEHAGAPTILAGTAAWLNDRDVDFHLHLRAGVPADFDRLTRILSGKGLGLVLGGGAARGFAHLGVYRALSEAHIDVDWVGGTSIGGVLGAAIAQGAPVDAVIETARRAFKHGRPFGDITIPVMSLLRGRRMEQLISTHLAGEIEDLPLPFFCVSSNLGQGTVRVHDRGPLAQAVRASAALPGVFPPAVIDGQLTIDGAILDNLPVDLMRRRPVGKVIAVDVTSRKRYEVKYDALPSPWAVIAGRWLPFTRRHRVPGFMSVVLKATEIGTMAEVRAAGLRADLLLRPPVSRFSLTDVGAFDEIVTAGYEYAQKSLASWQAH